MATSLPHAERYETVVLTEPVDYKGKTYAAGSYEVPIDGRYFSQLDRQIRSRARPEPRRGAHPACPGRGAGSRHGHRIGPAAGAGTCPALLGGWCGTLILTGGGLVWATRSETQPVPVLRRAATGLRGRRKARLPSPGRYPGA